LGPKWVPGGRDGAKGLSKPMSGCGSAGIWSVPWLMPMSLPNASRAVEWPGMPDIALTRRSDARDLTIIFASIMTEIGASGMSGMIIPLLLFLASG